MSADLYTTRLYWDGRRGCALHGGVRVELECAPPLGGHSAPYVVDFAPAARTGQIQPRPCDPRRDMTPEEMRAAQDLLTHLAATVRGLLSQGTPHHAT